MSHLSVDQQFAYDVLARTRMHAAIFGGAGTGKSTVLRAIRKCFDEEGEKYIVVAPTGVAALNVQGVTIHKAFGIPVRPGPVRLQYGCRRSRFQDEYGQSYLHQFTIIFDEISMVRADLFEALDVSLRIGPWDVPFGGARVVVVGDPLQLPPIVQDDDEKLKEHLEKRHQGSPWFFATRAWNELQAVPLLLEVGHRQQDPAFFECLNRLRYGDTSTLDYLNRWAKRSMSPEPQGVMIGTHRKQVQQVNQHCLLSCPGFTWEFPAEFEGHKPDALPVDEKLSLREGAQVLCAANLYRHMYASYQIRNDHGNDLLAANGSRGTVLSLDPVWVKFETGVEVQVVPHQWEFHALNKTHDRLEVCGKMRQLPLLLGWAITAHKSQGMSLSEIEINLSKAFDSGQAYVALSRVFSVYGLTLRQPLLPRYFRADANAVQFMHGFSQAAYAYRQRAA